MTALLAIETSGEVGSVAVATHGIVRERSIATPREQTERLLPLVEELLGEAKLRVADLDAVVFGRGPGSFTGLRIATAAAQGLAMAARLPVIGVSSLAGTAQRAAEAGVERSLVCIDARMGEVYWACFEVRDGLAQPAGEEHIGAPETVIIPDWEQWTALGAGFAAHAATLAHVGARAAQVLPEIYARARDLLAQAQADLGAGRVLAAAEARPTYLRDASAWRRPR